MDEIAMVCIDELTKQGFTYERICKKKRRLYGGVIEHGTLTYKNKSWEVICEKIGSSLMLRGTVDPKLQPDFLQWIYTYIENQDDGLFTKKRRLQILLVFSQVVCLILFFINAFRYYFQGKDTYYFWAAIILAIVIVLIQRIRHYLY